MSKRVSYLFAGLLFMVLAAVPAMAQFGAVEGDVKGIDGKPMVGAVISIDRLDMKGHWQTKTDKKGHYYYTGLPLGKMKITVKDGDKDMDSLSNVPIGLGDPQKVDFDLKSSQLRAQAAAAGIPVTQSPATGQPPKLSKEEEAKVQEEANKRIKAKANQEALSAKFNSGMEALKTKNCDQAVADLTEASTLDATQVAVWANLGDSYNCQSKTKSGDERKDAIAKALDAYQKALALKPDDGAIHHNMGLAMVGAGQTEAGIAELTKATQLDPTNAGKYYYNLGAVLTNQGKIDEAAQAFQNAIKADPNTFEAYYQLGIALMGKATLDSKTGKSVPAPGTIEAFQKYIDMNPNGPNVAVAKGMIETLGGTVTTEIKAAPTGKKKP